MKNERRPGFFICLSAHELSEINVRNSDQLDGIPFKQKEIEI